MQQRKCQSCKQQLDLPSVHFLCGHSYHKVPLLDVLLSRTAWTCPRKRVPTAPTAISEPSALFSSSLRKDFPAQPQASEASYFADVGAQRGSEA